MIIRNTQMTARQAADEFARTYSDEGRKVGCVAASPDAALLFTFVGGTRWYAVRCLPDYSGWDVSPENEDPLISMREADELIANQDRREAQFRMLRI